MSTTRIAIVTGAAALGIGRGIALRLADDGLDVAVNDLPQKSGQLEELANEIRAKGRRTTVFCGDMSEEADVKALVDKVVADLGGLDVMVANVGVAAHTPFLEMSVDEWDRIMRVNARGMMLQYKYAAQQLVKQGRGGRIIGASSIAGKRGAMNAAHYSASKFAVRGLTQSAALELGKYNITVNAYAPGIIKTELTTSLGISDEDVMAMVKTDFGLAGNMRVGEPENIAGLVSYLAKAESHFISGQTITVDSGLLFD
jgi:NAD(P)-dependent dehydrogenase (short-subunit alcohol dehydrogenase family)